MEMVPMIFDFNRNDKIGLLRGFFERAMYQSLVKIKYKAFATEMLRRYGRE